MQLFKMNKTYIVKLLKAKFLTNLMHITYLDLFLLKRKNKCKEL